MSMEQKFLKLLLRHDFFTENRGRLSGHMFPQEMKDLFETISEGHRRYERDLSLTDVRGLHRTLHPSMTTAAKSNLESLLDDLESEEDISEDLAKDVLVHMFKTDVGRRVADIGLSLMDGKAESLQPLLTLIEQTQDDFLPAEDTGEVPTDLDDIFEALSDRANWTFNIDALDTRIPNGIGPGELMVVMARPDAGKTAFLCHLVAAPGGFLEQGAQVHWHGNEEPMIRTAMRCVSSLTGLTKEELHEDRAKARNAWDVCRPRLHLRDAVDYSMEQLDAYCRRHKPDILLVDQLDKMRISGTYDAGVDKLRAIYVSAREIAKRHQCALIAVCQASAEAEGKTKVSYSMAEGSRTGKGAEADLFLGIGKKAEHDGDASEDVTRYLHISKNKLSGFKGTIPVLINPEISRYRA